MTDEPYKLSYSGERWYVSGPGVHLPFDCQIEAMQMQSACNVAYGLGRMTDEQKQHMKELRDACDRVTGLLEVFGRYSSENKNVRNIVKSAVAQATEAIKKVEGLIV